MAQAKRSKQSGKPAASRRPSKKAAAQERVPSYVWMLGLALLAVFITLSLLTDATGIVGRWLGGFLKGMLGIPAFLLPVLLLAAGISLAFSKNKSNTRIRIWFGAVAVLALSVFLHIFSEYAKGYAGVSFPAFVSTLYRTGGELTSGGVLGGLICTPLIMLLDKIGAGIVVGFILAVSLVFCLGNFFIRLKRALFPFTKEELGDTITDTLPAREQERPKKKRREQASAPEAPPVFARAPIRDIPVPEPAPAPAPDPEPAPVLHEEPAFSDIIHAIDSAVPDEIRPAAPASAPAPVPVPALDAEEIGKSLAAAAPEDEFANYKLPDISLLDEEKRPSRDGMDGELRATAKKLIDTLAAFGVSAKVEHISRGPSVTRYELKPGAGVKISRFTTLSEDIALALKAAAVRIEAPIPGKGTIGIEVANKDSTSIALRRIIASDAFQTGQSKLTAALGLDISGNTIVTDLAKMPHLLIAGATGSGKSVFVNALIMSILYKARPDEVKMVMVDPKRIELDVYNGIPHLISPVVTDPKKAAGALKWAVGEMMNRYKLFSESSSRNIQSYNEYAAENGEKYLPSIVIIIDELADIMMCAPHEVEDSICRLAQMARAAGIYLVIATQRPSTDVITGIIKANIPSRVAFAVASQIDSRIILDMSGAEKLLGRGDMLFLPIGRTKPLRVQGCFVSDGEIRRVVESIKEMSSSNYDESVIEEIERNASETQSPGEGGDSGDQEYDAMFPDAVEAVVDAGLASVSLLQRRLKLGYSRAARIVDEMESRGIVGPYEGSKPRKVLITRQQWQEMSLNMQK